MPSFGGYSYRTDTILPQYRFEFWQTSPPNGKPALVSRLVTASYWREQCSFFFPPEHEYEGGGTYNNNNTGIETTYTFSLARGQRAEDVNRKTGGWRSATNTTRVMHTNGELDPWREATLSARGRPGGPLETSEQVPVRVIPGGMHCSDLYAQNWAANDGVRRVVDEEVENMKVWVGEFYREKGIVMQG